MSLPLNQIVHGDCVEILQGFPENSVDLVVTDPPYGLNFMGKEWDKALPLRDAFKEIYRVLKPGALAFVMSSPRQDLVWRMCALLEGVGFDLSQSFISWIYKTGFPKAYDVSKGIDKRNNRTQEEYKELADYLKSRRKQLGLNQKAVSKHFPSKTGGLTGCVSNWELGYNLPTKNQWVKLKELLFLGDEFDYIIERVEAERETLVDRTMTQGGGHSYELRLGERREVEANITAPSLDNAKDWDGWKAQTGLKPALEPILMVNKPFSESTIVDNVLRWGTGAINIDACRIPFKSEKDKEGTMVGFNESHTKPYERLSEDNKTNFDRSEFIGTVGRFPANLIVSDKALDTGEITKSIKRKNVNPTKGKSIFGIGTEDYAHQVEYDDVGDQSRYFDLDAWAKHHGFLDVAKPDTQERDFGLKGKKKVPKSKFNLNDGQKEERFDGAVPTPRRNTHPTVKPIKLMAYLIELGCPKNGVVLDPFVGSGTTCIAAKRLCRKYIGIELSDEYHALAVSRVAAYPEPLEWFTQ